MRGFLNAGLNSIILDPPYYLGETRLFDYAISPATRRTARLCPPVFLEILQLTQHWKPTFSPNYPLSTKPIKTMPSQQPAQLQAL
jgi:hypothetical protein